MRIAEHDDTGDACGFGDRVFVVSITLRIRSKVKTLRGIVEEVLESRQVGDGLPDPDAVAGAQRELAGDNGRDSGEDEENETPGRCHCGANASSTFPAAPMPR